MGAIVYINMDELFDIKESFKEVNGIECGTPFVKTLLRAIAAYKNGESVGDNVEMKEVEIEFTPDWAVVGQYSCGDGPFRDFYYPTTFADGVETPTFLEIVDYSPVEGHRIKI